MSNEQSVELTGILLNRTSKAIQFQWTDEDSEDDDGHPIMRVEWFPLSQVNEIHNTDPATIKVSSWIMRQKRATWK